MLCGRFRDYWERNGGLERFGFPIGEVFNETAAIRRRDPRTKLAAGLTGVVDPYATALVLPFGQRTIYVYLARRGGTWQVVEATTIPSAAILRRRGIPEQLWSVPGAAESLDPVSAFYKREGAWRFLTAGSAFPEDNLRRLGVPRELWPYGEAVRGPSR
jgi:hypothetical protein